MDTSRQANQSSLDTTASHLTACRSTKLLPERFVPWSSFPSVLSSSSQQWWVSLKEAEVAAITTIDIVATLTIATVIITITTTIE